jgi:hypothetical protein
MVIDTLLDRLSKCVIDEIHGIDQQTQNGIDMLNHCIGILSNLAA